MKKTAHTLIILAMLCSASCRTALHESTEADSSAVRQEDNSEKYSRETIREYYPGPRDSVSTRIIQQVPVYIERIRESGEKKQALKEETKVSAETASVKKEGYSPLQLLAAGAGAMFLLMIMLIIAYKLMKWRFLAAIPKAVTGP